MLVLNDAPDQPLELRFNAPLPAFLPLGRRVNALVYSGGTGSAVYRLLALRDDAGKLLLVAHGGSDKLYQDGLFSTPEALGFSLELEMICQSRESGGCFENQIQAEYAATFKADDEVRTDGSSITQLHIGGVAYELTMWSSSVDGGNPTGCSPDITTGRYLDFSMLQL